MADEQASRYQQHCEKVCLLCAKGLGFLYKADQEYPRMHWSVINQDATPCTAPTLSDWAESESRRADDLTEQLAAARAERDKLNAKLAGAAVCDCYDEYREEGDHENGTLRSDPNCPVCGGRGVVLDAAPPAGSRSTVGAARIVPEPSECSACGGVNDHIGNCPGSYLYDPDKVTSAALSPERCQQIADALKHFRSVDAAELGRMEADLRAVRSNNANSG